MDYWNDTFSHINTVCVLIGDMCDDVTITSYI
jgi:hypothetical protein